jgi:hypothetical protein
MIGGRAGGGNDAAHPRGAFEGPEAGGRSMAKVARHSQPISRNDLKINLIRWIFKLYDVSIQKYKAIANFAGRRFDGLLRTWPGAV